MRNKCKEFKTILQSLHISFCFLFLIFFSCSKPPTENPPPPPPFLNLADSVTYVGAKECATCHTDKFNSFLHTGMGQSFDVATQQKSSANFENQSPVYDKYSDFYYEPFWKNDSLRILEFRLIGKDTVHKRMETIDYIIGSGQHTNSHIINTNGYLTQAPLTFYTQRKIWDLPPGFENGNNSRFSRQIGLECMTCHNGYPEFQQGSVNKFTLIKNGIDCERCHGPGSLHVGLKRQGIHVDLEKEHDYSIVNPIHLSVDRQMDICQRCHLQGNTVLKPDKTFFDFKPGRMLSEVMDVFMPRYKDEPDHFIMASHADRLRMSKCFIESMKKRETDSTAMSLTCLNCHNPHLSVTLTPQKSFNSACQKCHTVTSGFCTETPEKRNSSNNDCVTCHMPQSGTRDIPHVMTTDHRIGIHTIDEDEKKKKYVPGESEMWKSGNSIGPTTESTSTKLKEFIGLVCLTDKNPSYTTLTKGWINYFEKFNPNPAFLDSALYYHTKIKPDTGLERKELAIHIYFLKEDYKKIINIYESLENNFSADAWTYYRIGESYSSNQNSEKAEYFYKTATLKEPFILEFRNKYGSALMANNKTDMAKKEFEFILKENPKSEQACNNLGFLFVQMNELKKAEKLFFKALELNPDYELALANTASLFLNGKNYHLAEKYTDKLIKQFPGNAKYQWLREQISKKSSKR
ncbi:MAG: hypothetical protein A3H98_02780 [Bacteroidetes bacterium RIFCSPLOWO2_02_FULL_36_8]|nr:MAG: hypothetical protein A3H98_02780 [Bacteroidetes bacterium RIFCSPLOWO2_02_FULL_36_8]